VIEMCHKKDIADAIKLLAACVCELDKHDWSF
jgi:putative aminopeptidase FrvX